ncbi:hypothetical protein [Pasteuria penetrans]|uniref:hypothetical protein n=1 Tax=Pasteuria penetrans TaxID=86005 RepID=UPI00165C3E20|nr:hypothetical protein [Pasteuria penetrans]
MDSDRKWVGVDDKEDLAHRDPIRGIKALLGEDVHNPSKGARFMGLGRGRFPNSQVEGWIREGSLVQCERMGGCFFASSWDYNAL